MAVGLHVEAISFGYALFLDAERTRKLCVVTNACHNGLYRVAASGRVAVLDPLPEGQWKVHWCGPSVTSGQVCAVAECLRSLPPHPAPTVDDLRPG
jgi:hypothetical protein